MQKGVVVDLLDEEIRYVGARDDPACPAARIDQRAIGEERIVRRSKLDWVIVRPVILTDGPKTRGWRIDTHAS